MKLSNLEIKAAIFDLDGTLLDSTNIWSHVDENFFHSRGMEVPPTYNKDISTMGLDEAAVYTKATYHLNESVESIRQEWLDAVQEGYANEVLLKDGAKEFMDQCKNNSLPMAVATANTKECYEPCLRRLGVLDDFLFIEDVKKYKGGKQTPAIFTAVGEMLKEKSEDILVFEDTLVAIQSAKKAGFKVCAVADKHCSEEDEKIKREIADIYITTFKDLMK